MTADLSDWITHATGHPPLDPELFRRALTHSSHDGPSYERLEFLGDRVLGLAAAGWLFERFSDEPEGKLSARLNALVSREACAEIGRDLGVPQWLILGRQARDDGAQSSDNVVGDVTEALIGALYLERGFEAAASFVRARWTDRLDRLAQAPKHPKSALQEWAAAHRCRAPVYTLVNRSGPHHAPRFVVRVEVGGQAGGAADATGGSKHEAETAAATTLLESLQ